MYLPQALLVPNARFGIYIAAKALLSAGDRVLISPVTCRTVIDALLRAGVTPVFVDIELKSGNIDVARLAAAELGRARAIVTTNLYGNPDEAEELSAIARSRGLLLIEDCAHVLQTRIGSKEIGSFGDISVFSFKKHFDLIGGMVCTRDRKVAEKLETCIASEATPPPIREERLRYCQFRLAKTAGTDFTTKVASLYRGLGLARRAARSQKESAPAKFDVESHFIQALPTTSTLLRMVNYVSYWQETIDNSKSKAEALIAECWLPLKTSRVATDLVHLAVPFNCVERNSIIAELRSLGVPTYFLYSPPMNQVFQNRVPVVGGFDEDRVNEWSLSILPVLPQYGQEFLNVIGNHFLAGTSHVSRPESAQDRQPLAAGR